MTKQLTVDLDEELIDRTESFASRSGKSVSQVVTDLLERFLVKPEMRRMADARNEEHPGPRSKGVMPVDPETGGLRGPGGTGAASKTTSGPSHGSDDPELDALDLPPLVRSLVGILEGTGADEADYRLYLEEKYR